MLDCYPYSRISGRGRQLKGDGISRQKRLCMEVCEKKGWRVANDTILNDIGRSAFHSDNIKGDASLGKFLQAVQNKRIKTPAVLLIENLDRLSRAKVSDHLKLFMTIVESGVIIYTYNDDQEYSQPTIDENYTKLIMALTYMDRAHEESLIKSRRKKESWKMAREKIAKGIVVNKQIYPSWVDIVNGKPELNQKKAKAIRTIFDLCINKNMGFLKLHAYIRENNLEDLLRNPNRASKRKQISNKFFHKLFNTKSVLGIYEPTEHIRVKDCKKVVKTGDEIKAFPAVVSEEIYYQARAAIEKRKKNNTGRPTKKIMNFFKNVLQCGYCKSSYILTTSGNTGIYRCGRKYLDGNKCPQTSKLSSSKFQFVLFTALSYVSKSDLLDGLNNKKIQELRSDISLNQEKLLDKKKRVDNLFEAIQKGSKRGLDIALDIEKEIGSIEAKIKDMEYKANMLSTPVMAGSLEQINNFQKQINITQASTEERNSFNDAVCNVVENITILSPEKEGQRSLIWLHLYSGIRLKIVIYKDYSADIYKNKKWIARFSQEQLS